MLGRCNSRYAGRSPDAETPMTALPPGRRARFLGGNLAELRRDPLGLYTRCAREFGDVSPTCASACAASSSSTIPT